MSIGPPAPRAMTLPVRSAPALSAMLPPLAMTRLPAAPIAPATLTAPAAASAPPPRVMLVAVSGPATARDAAASERMKSPPPRTPKSPIAVMVLAPPRLAVPPPPTPRLLTRLPAVMTPVAAWAMPPPRAPSVERGGGGDRGGELPSVMSLPACRTTVGAISVGPVEHERAGERHRGGRGESDARLRQREPARLDADAGVDRQVLPGFQGELDQGGSARPRTAPREACSPAQRRHCRSPHRARSRRRCRS